MKLLFLVEKPFIKKELKSVLKKLKVVLTMILTLQLLIVLSHLTRMQKNFTLTPRTLEVFL